VYIVDSGTLQSSKPAHICWRYVEAGKIRRITQENYKKKTSEQNKAYGMEEKINRRSRSKELDGRKREKCKKKEK
jgi:hypothetical protein